MRQVNGWPRTGSRHDPRHTRRTGRLCDRSVRNIVEMDRRQSDGVGFYLADFSSVRRQRVQTSDLVG